MNIIQQLGRPAIALMAMAMATTAVDAQTVRVSTNNTDLVLKVSPKGRLYQVCCGYYPC